MVVGERCSAVFMRQFVVQWRSMSVALLLSTTIPGLDRREMNMTSAGIEALAVKSRK